MKFTNLALAVALTCGLFATSTQAQEGLREAALTYNYYAQDNAAPSPSDLAAVDSSDITFVGDVSQKDGKGGSKDGKGGKGCNSCDPWRIFPTIGNGWIIDGWLNGGVTVNADDPTSNYNGPTTFNDRNEVQANQTYMRIGREADNGGCGLAWGGQIDVLYGSDYIFTQAVGLELDDEGADKWNGFRHYGVALPQAYVDVAYNDLALRIGHFYTIMGYEGVKATSNFFYSHAYTMQYGEPFTHTGGMFTYDFNDKWILYGGLVNGWDKFDAESDKLAFLGGATYTPCHEQYTITVTVMTGDEDGAVVRAAAPTERTGYSLVFDYTVNDRMNYVLQHDNFWDEDVFGAGLDAEWYGINQYLFYTVNDCWKLGARFEWFRDDDGVRLSGAPLRESLTGGAPTGGFLTSAAAAGNYYNFTLGANWTPRTNLTVRPEARFDWSDGTAGRPFDDHTKDAQFTGAIDAILVF
ncbi:MAG: hypothetical protein CMJ64_30165 [Planctomycetaceae bacterium]|nr:hypothetical protein [Planctomycetaceae bacterium]